MPIIRLKNHILPKPLRDVYIDYMSNLLKEVPELNYTYLSTGGLTTTYDEYSQFIIFYSENKIKGFIEYWVNLDVKILTIKQAYVVPYARQQGIFKRMYSYLRNYAKEEKLFRIDSWISPYANHKNQQTFNRVKLNQYVIDVLEE